MINQTDAPERIWVETRTCTVDAIGASRLLAMDREFSRGTEYIRKDLSDAKDERIEELEAERDETMREALSLARSLHKAHYSDVTQWEPLNYPAGVVSQIDNMVAGIVARAEAAEATT